MLSALASGVAIPIPPITRAVARRTLEKFFMVGLVDRLIIVCSEAFVNQLCASLSSGSDKDEKSKSQLSSCVRGPAFLLDFLSDSRKSRSGEGLVSHGCLFSFDIINIVYIGPSVNMLCASLAADTKPCVND